MARSSRRNFRRQKRLRARRGERESAFKKAFEASNKMNPNPLAQTLLQAAPLGPSLSSQFWFQVFGVAVALLSLYLLLNVGAFLLSILLG